MDTVHTSYRLLLWIVLVLQCLEVSAGSDHVCPQGQLLHWHTVYSRPHVTCCYPTRCAVGQEVRPCSVNGTQDMCHACAPYQNQSLRTSSYTMEPCQYWPLDKECKSVDNPDNLRNIDDERTRRCLCDIEQGKKFDLPESDLPGAPMDSYCQRRTDPCKAGEEPMVDGGCRPCRENYFNSAGGFSLCQPKTNCTMLGLRFITNSITDRTADSNCSEPDPVTTPKPYVPAPTSQKSSPILIAQTSTTMLLPVEETGRIGLSHDPEKNENDLLVPIIVTVSLLLLLMISIVLILFWRRRRGMSIWACAPCKNYTDPEKNYVQGSTSMLGDPQGKHMLGDGYVIPPHLTNGSKPINNNINGGVHCGLSYIPNGHPNGGIPRSQYNHSDGNNSDRPFCVNTHQYHLVSPSQHSRLRNANHNVVYGQSRGNVLDRSIDSIGQEKLQVHVDDFEANQDIGENDPLLVPDYLRGAAPCQMQNLAASVGNSPPVMQAGMNPLHLLAYSNPGRPNFSPTFVHSGAVSPPVQPVVTYAPATGTVTFTRSTSVIASPEGEVDEDEIEARLPRLSQLLTEGEDPSVAESHARDFFRADSPGRETTQQLRAPSQRLVNHSPKNGTHPNQQLYRQGNHLAQQRPGFSPAIIGPVLQKGPQVNQPDHRIMNLKEQQLAESLHSSPGSSPATNGQHRTTSDFPTNNNNNPESEDPNPEDAQQTEVKTQLHPATDTAVLTTGARANAKGTKTGQDNPEAVEAKQVVGGKNSTDRKRQISGGSNGQNTLEKKHAPSGTQFQNVSDRKHPLTNNSGGQGTLERQRVPSGDQQKPCIKQPSSEESNTSAKRHNRYGRTVSFEEEDNPPHHGPSAECKLPAKPHGPSESSFKHRGPLRSISDPEQKAMTNSDGEETERKCVSLEYNASTGSSKTSVNSDVSGTDSGSSSPCRTALYRRSQSENAPSSCESPHKPPPRSMSEEKPQKLDRPIAKVKPMPASDNAVNQLPTEVVDDMVTGSGGALPHGHNSSDSEHEEDSDGNESTASALEENDEEMCEAEEESEGIRV